MPRRICVAVAFAAVLIPASRSHGDWRKQHDEGIAALERGDRETATRLLTASMAAADEAGVPHEYFERSMMRLGRIQQRAGQYAQAEHQYRRALTVREAEYGPEDPRVVSLLSDLATVCAAQEKYGDATALTRRILAIQEAQLGPDHLDVGVTLFRLANYAVEMGACADAEALLVRSLPITNARLGNATTLPQSLESFAAVQLFDRHYHLAQTLYRRALDLRSAESDDTNPRIQILLTTLGFMNEQLGRWDDAEAVYQRAFDATRSDLVATRLWHVRARKGEREVGDEALARHLALRRAGADRWNTQLIRYLLGQVDEASLLGAAARDDPVAEASNLCEAYYFIGARRELDGDFAKAAAAFKASVDTDVQSALAFRSAVASLDRIRDDVMITSVDEGAARLPE